MGLRSGPGQRVHWTRLRREGSEGSEGSKDSEGDGGGFAASFKEKGRGWRRGLCRRVVFAGAQGATAPAALKVADCRSAAMLIKSALRDWLSMSYGMISILLTGSLRSPPPIRLRRTSPCSGGQNKTPRNILFINGSTVSTGYSATVEVLHRTSKWGEVRRLACPLRRFPFAAPPNCGGKVVAPATKGGIAFPRPSGRLYGFPAAAGGISNSPLNQPALWAEPIVRCAAHER